MIGPSRPRIAKSGWSNSSPPDSGRSGVLGPADERLLVAERLAVPDLDRHVDPARDEVGAAGEPVPRRVVAGRDPDVLVERLGLLGLDVHGAVLEAEQVARRGLRGRRGRRPAEAELRPAHGDRAEADPGQVADRVHRDLRVVGAGLDAEVAVRADRVEVVGREVRQLLERRGPPVGQAEPVLAVLVDEQRRPEAERDRQPGRRQPDRLAGVVGRQVVGAVERADRRRRSRPASSARRPSVQACSSATSSSRDVVVTSNAAKCSRSWAGVMIPAWCSPRNG